MATFFTALVWGLGVSLGATAGLLVFGLARGGLDWALGRFEVKDFSTDSLRALDRIAEALEKKDSK